MKTLLAVIVLGSLAAFLSACRDPQPQSAPDYDATRRDSQKAHHGLDNENGN